MSLRSFTGCCLTAVLLAAPAAQAGMAPVRSTVSEIRVAAMGCGPGYYRDASGVCLDYLDRTRSCGLGYFAVPFPNGNGYRCVPTTWLSARGWLSDLL